MKTPQVPAMPGMTPLGAIKRCEGCNGCAPWYRARCPARLAQLAVTSPLAVDQKTVAERKWQSRKLAPAPQKPCDVGLFSDDAKQLDLMEKCK